MKINVVLYRWHFGVPVEITPFKKAGILIDDLDSF